MGARVDIADAIRHLRARVAKIETADSRHRPHWTQADLDAVAALVDIPASAEQIALARIEGITWNGNSYEDAHQPLGAEGAWHRDGAVVTPSAVRLRQLADAATFGQGHDGFYVVPGTGDAAGMWVVWERIGSISADVIATVECQEHASLIALAPALARSHADLLDWAQDAARWVDCLRRYLRAGL